MVVIETREVTFACGDKAYFRVAYMSEDPGREIALCLHAHPSRLSAAQCEEAREKCAHLWTEEEFERAWHTL